MASSATETWWSTFLDAQGRDSEEEAGFNGFLTTNGIPAASDPGTLQEAYANFRQWMEECEGRQADLGPDRAEWAKQQAVIALEQQFVPKSRVSAPGVEKPYTAVTRPKETRKPLDTGAAPGPEGEANVAPQGEASPTTTGSETPPATEPEVSVESSSESRGRYGRSRGSEGGV